MERILLLSCHGMNRHELGVRSRHVAQTVRQVPGQIEAACSIVMIEAMAK
jgi:hypothetical protein